MKAIFVLVLLLFLLAGLMISTSHQGAALKIFILSFWVLVLGVFLFVRRIEGKK